jgi:hypothetical protein
MRPGTVIAASFTTISSGAVTATGKQQTLRKFVGPVWWLMPVITATQEAEVGGLPPKGKDLGTKF